MKLKESILLYLLHIKFLNRWIVFIIDLFFSVLSVCISLKLVQYTAITVSSDLRIELLLLFGLLAGIISIFFFKTYKGIIRHSAFSEIFRIAMASLVKVLLLVSFIRLFGYHIHPLSLLASFDLFMTFFLLVFFRSMLIVSYYWLGRHFSDKKDNILLYYDPSRMSDLIPAQFSDSNGYQVMGYISYGSGKQIRIEGYPVYYFKDEADIRQMTDLKIKSILFPNASAARLEQDRLMRYCEKIGVSTLLVPSIRQWEEQKKIKLSRLAPVRIEDLLGRDEININMDEISRALKGKTVMVTGAAGSIGSELCRQLCTFGLKQLVLFDSAETPMHNIRLELEETFPQIPIHPIMGDVRMKERVERVFSTYKPEVVFHAAAYKHVPLMEENPCEAVHTNVLGTRIVANAAVRNGVSKFVMISTDKAVNPSNVMGASKRLAEIYVQSLSEAIDKGLVAGKTKFVTTRFGNVLGSNGSVIPRFREQLRKGGPLTVTHPDIIRFFMTIPEACRLVLEAAFLGSGNDIFVFDMGEPVKIDTLARRMIELSGLIPDRDIRIVYTGLRPGEKLYEEILASKENTLPTTNKQIFRAKVREYDYHKINAAFDHFYELTLQLDKMAIVCEMKQIVPEFKSKNSVFEKLDQFSV